MFAFHWLPLQVRVQCDFRRVPISVWLRKNIPVESATRSRTEYKQKYTNGIYSSIKNITSSIDGHKQTVV